MAPTEMAAGCLLLTPCPPSPGFAGEEGEGRGGGEAEGSPLYPAFPSPPTLGVRCWESGRQDPARVLDLLACQGFAHATVS